LHSSCFSPLPALREAGSFENACYSHFYIFSGAHEIARASVSCLAAAYEHLNPGIRSELRLQPDFIECAKFSSILGISRMRVTFRLTFVHVLIKTYFSTTGMATFAPDKIKN